MAILHLLQQHPKDGNLTACLHRCGSSDAIVLLEDAVYALIDDTENERRWSLILGNMPIYALKPHLQARGLQRLQLRNHTIIDMAELVNLTATYNSSISW